MRLARPDKSGVTRAEASAYDRALRQLARREQSRHELQQGLQRRGFGAGEVIAALDRLRDEGYQSDARFAAMLARTRIAQGYGPARIRAELHSHALDAALLDAVLTDNETDWVAMARAQLRRRYTGAPPAAFAERARRAQFLLRRGFDQATVRASTRAECDDDGRPED